MARLTRRRTGQPVEGRPGYKWERVPRDDGGPLWRQVPIPGYARQQKILERNERVGRKVLKRKEREKQQRREARSAERELQTLEREQAEVQRDIEREQAQLDRTRARTDRTRLNQMRARRRLLTGGVSLLGGAYRGFA